MTVRQQGLDEAIPAWVGGRLVPMPKLAVHEQGLRHPAVSVFVLRGDEMLLQQRAAGKYHTPLLWANSCCTHPRWAEDPAACATRRLAEELGIRGLVPVHADRLEYRAEVGGGLVEHELVDVYLARAGADLTIARNPEEVAATRWVTLPALLAELRERPGAFTPWLRIYMTDHLERIFGGEVPFAG
jgi:isopentenyl-diphosphate delta-isomerase